MLSVLPIGREWAYPASKHNINFVILDRTAGCGPACPVVWEGGGFPSPCPGSSISVPDQKIRAPGGGRVGPPPPQLVLLGAARSRFGPTAKVVAESRPAIQILWPAPISA